MPSPCEISGRPDERVLRQFAAALIFEGFVDARATRDGARLRWEWSLGGRSYRCRAEVAAFGRVRIEPGSIERLDADGVWREASLRGLVEAATGTTDSALLTELEHTVAFCRWNADNIEPNPRREMDFAALDCALDEGHPYHPCYKARTGFSIDDHRAYGPEAGNTFRLVWLAVDRALLDQMLPCDDVDFWRDEFGEEVSDELFARMDARGADRHALVPVHPWQWGALARGLLAPHLRTGAVVFLGEAGDRYKASQSVRTLHNADHPEKASVKLAISMANTSAMRTLEPHSICVAPVLSRWLKDIVASDPDLDGRLGILGEYAGIAVDREGPLSGQLGAIWRESVEAGLRDGEAAVPFNALMVVEADGKPFAAAWIATHGLDAWLDRLLDVVVTPVWLLLARHGVATESHGQNMVLVHRDGWPERLILRDFHDSVEFTTDFLGAPTQAPDLARIDPVYRDAAPDRFHRMSTVEELRALVMDCLFVFNLSEVAHLLTVAYGLAEADFWARVDQRLRACGDGLSEREARLGARAPEIFVETLLTPKLPGGPREARRLVPNALEAAA